MMKTLKTYSEIKRLTTFEERYNYLRLNGQVGVSTFGHDRYLNQMLYHNSKRWRSVRDEVIIRDDGCDLGIPDRQIYDKILIHHMNPITITDIEESNDDIFNPEYLICCCLNTHNAIHFGDASLLIREPVVRRANDTCPWRKDIF